MKTAPLTLAALLAYAILTAWVDERWAWAAFQLAVFAFAAREAVRATPRWRAAHAALAAAAAWPFVQLLLDSTLSRARTLTAALDWITFLLVFLLSSLWFADVGARRRFLIAIAVLGMLVAPLAVLQNYSSGGKIFWLFASGYEQGVFGPFVNRNQFAAWLELLLPAALYLAVAERRLRPLLGCASAAMFGAVVASGSRAGAVLASAEVVVAAAAIAVRWASAKRTLVLAAQFVILAVAAAAVGGWQTLWARIDTGQAEAIRLDAVRASLQMIRARPWTGSGLGTWGFVYPRYAGFDSGVVVNQAHNDWAQWAAEGGLPFALALIIFAALLCRPALRSIYGLGTVVFLLHALVDYPMQQRPALAAWFFALAGAAVAWQRQVPTAYDEPLRGTGTRSVGLTRGDPPGV